MHVFVVSDSVIALFVGFFVVAVVIKLKKKIEAESAARAAEEKAKSTVAGK